jgi:Na+/pantothenate symporter
MTSVLATAVDLGPPAASPYTLVAFAAYSVGVLALGALAHHLLSRGSFLKEYFLGDRKLNAWVLSLTYVATSVSAGSFVGFPSLIYQYGWVMALWIAGYMVSGLTTKGVLAKRLNQVSRISGAITVPDVLRDRFQSPALGLLSSLFLLVFLLFNLVGQFKAVGLIMRQAFAGVVDTSGYQHARGAIAAGLKATGLWAGPGDGLYGAEYPDYVLGILLFLVIVVAYTTYGGFWAVTWTDVLQGLVMVGGAVLLMALALVEVGGLSTATHKLAAIDGRLLTAPGPDDYVPVGLAVSCFFLWTISPMGHPVGMVRLMACRDTPTLRRSLFLITIYFALIYLPLTIAFVCARALYPERYLAHSDPIMPALAVRVTERVPLLGGFILAAPYSAAMSSVAGSLLLMSSCLVRDLYQRTFNPNVSARGARWASYGTTAAIGALVTLVALRPPRFLQYLIIFSGAGQCCTFLAPTVLGLYWRRATRAGALAALWGGFACLTLPWLLGYLGYGKEGQAGAAGQAFAPIYFLGLDPLIHGLVGSFALGLLVSLVTAPLPGKHVDRYFLAGPRSA